MKENKLTIKDSALSFLIGFLISQLAVTVCTGTIHTFATIFKWTSSSYELFLNTAIGYLIVSLVLYVSFLLVFLYFNKGKDNKINSKPKTKKILLYILVAVISFLTLYPIVTCFDSLIIKLGFSVNTITYPLTLDNYALSLISLVIAPSVCEELLFRGLIFQGLKKFGKTFSIITSSIMFCLYHMAISQTIYPLLMGLLLAVIMYHEENIYYCIAVHLTNNFITLTLAYFKINLIFNHWTYILLAIFLAISFIIVTLTLTLKNNKQTINKPSKDETKILKISIIVMLVLWILSNLI